MATTGVGDECDSAVKEAEPKEELQRAVTKAESKEKSQKKVTIVEPKEELQRAVKKAESKEKSQKKVTIVEPKEELQSAVTKSEPKEELQKAVTEAEPKEESQRTVTIVESKEELQRSVKEAELKAELQRAVKEIISSIDINVEAIDRAERALRSLRTLIEKKRLSSVVSSAPDEFRCYLSKKIMKHPVLIANGQTYERSFIQEWFKSEKKTCPRTQQELSHTDLIPNLLVQEMISDWCKSNSIHLQDKVELQGMTEADRNNLHSLLQRISSGLSAQRDAAKELRMLTRSMHPFRALFGESENLIPQLISPLCEPIIQEELQEDIITTLFNISLHDDNKKLIAET
ncbi:unnamed protein product, partial [Cuscuta epithymum]